MKIIRLTNINKTFNFLRKAVIKYYKDDINVKAAGLAFYQLLTIIPIIMLLFYFLGKILNNEKIFYKVLNSLTVFDPNIQTFVMRNIQRIMDTKLITAIFGFFLFLFLTRKYLRELLLAVKRIIGEAPDRSKTFKASLFRYLRNFIKQLLYICLYIFAIGFGAVMSSLALNFFGILEKLAGQSIPHPFSEISTILLIALPISSNTALYYVIYFNAPDYKPSKKHALFGAIFCSFGIEIISFFYKIYIEIFLPSTIIYGPLTTVAALIIWYYLSSIIILFGAIIVSVLDEGHHRDYII